MLQTLLAGRETASLQLTAPLPEGVALHLAIRPSDPGVFIVRKSLTASFQFALCAFLVVLALDALLSFAYQSPPAPEIRRAFLLAHGMFHAAVLGLSALGACVGFIVIRNRIPSIRQNLALAAAYGVVTSVTAFGAFLLSGLLGVAAWLVFGSMSFAIGSALFTKPWRRAV